jgi:hypothetical protein
MGLLRTITGPQILSEWLPGSTVGRDEEMIGAYIRNQQLAGNQLDQLQFGAKSCGNDTRNG